MTKFKTKDKRTIINNKNIDLDLDIDLENILKQAENITLDSLDFNKTFKEQGKILCEIKHMLSKNNKNRDNKNVPFTCNPIISRKLNDKSFNELFTKYKKQNKLLLDSNISKSSKIKMKSRKKPNNIKSKLTSKTFKSNQKSKNNNKKNNNNNNNNNNNKKKITKYKLNTRYPIVIIKKRTPRKNVIYLNK